MFHWLAHHFGTDNGGGGYYLWWSGAGSDLAELALIGAGWKLLNCHEPGCWRLGTHATLEADGHHFRRCKRHHLERHR